MNALGWAKPLGYDRGVSTAFHAVVAIERGAFVTACSGRWSTGSDLAPEHERWVFFLGISPCCHSAFPVYQYGVICMDPPCPACLREVGSVCAERRDHNAREPSTFIPRTVHA